MEILKSFQVDENGYYGDYGGAFIPELYMQIWMNWP